MLKREDKIVEYLRKFDPVKLGLDSIGLVEVKELNRGGFNMNYLVEIDGNKFVFRLNIDKYLDVENQIEYEYGTLKCLEGSKVTPKVFFIDITKGFFEQDILVEEYIENKPIDFNANFLSDLGKLVKKIHSISCEPSILINNSKPLDDQWNFIKKQIKIMRSIELSKDILNFLEPYTLRVDKYVAKHADMFTADVICINHRDLAIENVLQTEMGLKLIDWQTAMIDDPSYDLAYFPCYIDLERMIGFRERPLSDEENRVFLESYQIDELMFNKINVRRHLIYLELFVWVSYRYVYLQNKLDNNLAIDEADAKYAQEIVDVCRGFLREREVMKEYLDIFHNHD